MTDKQEKIIKATFAKISEFKTKFHNATCALPISVGQNYHEGDKLLATVELINKSKFENCTISICDTLQRHTLSIADDLDIDSSYEKSLLAGNNWLQRNIKILNQLTIPYTIYRWDRWLKSSDFINARQKIEDFYVANTAFRDTIDNTITLFLGKHIKYGNSAQIKCMEYLKEECAVEILWIKESFGFEIYPSNRNPAMKTVYENFIRPHHPELQRWLKVVLRTKSTQ